MSSIPQHIPIGQKVDVASSGCIGQPAMRNLGIVDTREKLLAYTRAGLGAGAAEAQRRVNASGFSVA